MTLVSIVVPMHNAEAFISETLDSILQESNVPFEVIVVNDACTDSSPDKVLAYQDDRIRMVNGPGQGYVAAVNIGFSSAKGEIIMRCDADDLYPPGRIARQVDWLTKYPEWGAVCGGFATIDTRGRLIANLKTAKAEETTEELCSGVIRNHFCTYAIRSALLSQLGGARPELNGAAELDILLRLGEIGRVWYLPEIDYFYRLHDQSLTHTQRDVERLFFDNLIIELQQQRRTKGQDNLQLGLPLPPVPEAEDESIMRLAPHIQGQLLGRAWQEHQVGKRLQAVITGLRAAMTYPQNLSVWRSLLALVIKPSSNQAKL